MNPHNEGGEDIPAAPLAGMTVLDLTDHRGELGPWMLAELGAEVTKIEPRGGTAARSELPLRPGPHDDDLRSLQFCAYNANKRSVVVDFDADADRRLFERLIAEADFVYESGVPGTLSEPATPTTISPC